MSLSLLQISLSVLYYDLSNHFIPNLLTSVTNDSSLLHLPSHLLQNTVVHFSEL